jgi:hypothetical protein
MHPIEFEGSKEIKKPRGVKDEDCSSTWAAFGVDNSGFQFSVQAWKPNYEDLQALNRGEPIYIKICLPTLPMIAMFTMDEKGDVND